MFNMKLMYLKNNIKKYFRLNFFIHFVNVTRKLINFFGGVLLSKSENQHLLEQRSRLIRELSKLISPEFKSGLSGLVFSKDRAMQLYAMLETYFKFVENPAPLIIIYHASNELHEKSYKEVGELFPKIKLVNEQFDFRKTLITELEGIKTANLFFLTDDNIFIRKINFKYASSLDTSQFTLSLRHSPRLKYNYTTGAKQKPPEFINLQNQLELVKFNWFEQKYHWSDPWSVDGHVYSTSEILVLSQISDFKAPNTYESELKTFGHLMIKRPGLCYDKSIILNLPINRVQEEFLNKSGNISVQFLLDKWNKGYKINTSIYENSVPESTHEEHSVSFQKRLLL